MMDDRPLTADEEAQVVRVMRLIHDMEEPLADLTTDLGPVSAEEQTIMRVFLYPQITEEDLAQIDPVRLERSSRIVRELFRRRRLKSKAGIKKGGETDG